MKCLLKYQWVKFPRNILLTGKGIMGSWLKLASRAAYREGQSNYCGFTNHVEAGSWSGGIVGVKSILNVKMKQKSFDILNQLQELELLEYTLEAKTKKLTYKITDWVMNYNGETCIEKKAMYATDGYGFICIPRSITDKLVDKEYVFDESDAWLDLWCHTIWQDEKNIFSTIAPTVQYGKYGSALTLEILGQRWRWEKTKVWRFFKKTKTFILQKLPGSFGSLIFNNLYPTECNFEVPSLEKIKRILSKIRIYSDNTHLVGTDNYRINRFITWFSKKIQSDNLKKSSPSLSENRVAVSNHILRAYFSLCRNCKNYINDCVRINILNPFKSIYSLKLNYYVVDVRGG